MRLSTKSIIREAPAKLNLYLRVTGRRDNGFHELDSLVAFTGLHDTLRIEPADELRLDVAGPFADALTDPSENLVLQAARRLVAALGETRGAHILLTKKIPVAAGLGGGSADAAATLLGLCELWRIDGSRLNLNGLAAGIGADVPVCLYGRTALMRGIGELVEPGPDLPDAGLMLVNPRHMLATSAVFRARRGAFSPVAPCPAEIGSTADFARILSDGRNDLLEPAATLCPEIETVLGRLASIPGCRFAGMSGSGPTCFGLFDNVELAQQSAESITQFGWWVEPTSLRSGASFGERGVSGGVGGFPRSQGR